MIYIPIIRRILRELSEGQVDHADIRYSPLERKYYVTVQIGGLREVTILDEPLISKIDSSYARETYIHYELDRLMKRAIHEAKHGLHYILED